MPEIDQYTLKHRELLELLIKYNNVHEGQWAIMFNIAIGMGKFGPDPENTFPGAAVSIAGVGLKRVAPGEPTEGPGVIVLDAAKVNPKHPAKPSPKRRAKS